MKLTIDFETRSPVDLKKCGVYKYAEHPWTDVMCLCVKEDDEPVRVWLTQWVRNFVGYLEENIVDIELMQLIAAADTIEAHNVEFERAIWNSVMVNKYGFHPLPEHKLRCSAAKASVVGLPRALGKACKAMRLPQQKDDEGSKVMMKLTKPRRPVIKERKELESLGWIESEAIKQMWITPEGKQHYFFHEKPEDYLRLIEYCKQDVVAEHCLSEVLPDLSPEAQKLWHVDQIINMRGITVDVEGCEAMIKLCDTFKNELNFSIQLMTEGAVDKGTKLQPMLAWLAQKGIELDSLDASSIETTLCRSDLPEDVRALLEHRQLYSKSSVSKYEAALRHAQDDHKIRGMFLFHGAHTGRWSGRGVQLQNLPSRGVIKDPEVALQAIKNGMSNKMIEHLWGSTLSVASSCIRSVLMADEGKELIVADYSAIEGRILAWLAGEQYILDAYSDGRDTYKIAAAGVYGVRYDDVTPDQRQVGKVIELSSGYQGYVGAFQAMAKGYGLTLPEDTVKEVVMKWRQARPMTTKLWEELYAAATLAMTNPGRIAKYRMIQYKFDGTHLMCKLPSGRLLWYPFAAIKPGVTPWGKAIEVISYMSEDSMTRQWLKQDTYGGLLAENVTQSVSADLISHALVQLHDKGWHPILHVHDEVGCEEPIKDKKTVKQLCDIMCDLPSWAEGLPVTAAGWKGKRYRK